MRGYGRAVAYGAITIVNALATGRGAALSIDLWTEARVKLTEKVGVVEATILSDPEEDTRLVEEATRAVLARAGLEKIVGAEVETESNIPIARGLKSSSVAANALVLATSSAIRYDLGEYEAISIAVDAAVKAGVTVTGAFDDASASFLGNLVVTDNRARKILRHFSLEEGYKVVITYPTKKSYTSKVDIERVRVVASEVEAAFKEALRGDYWRAMNLNGLIYGPALKYDSSKTIDALAHGAVAASISGKGPAFAAVVPIESLEDVEEALPSRGWKVTRAEINRQKAHIIE